MTTHPTLFDDELGPFQRHSDTSHDAAVLGYSMTGKDRRRVLLDLHAHGDDGATDHEIQVRLDMNPSTERPRRVELVERGLAVDSGADAEPVGAGSRRLGMHRQRVSDRPSTAGVDVTSDADLIELWEDAHRALLTPVVITEYLRYLRELAKWLPDELDKSLRDARREDLAEFQAVQTRWSPSTRQTHCRRGIRSFYAWLFNAGLIGENPADDLPKIEVPDAVVRVADDRTRDALVAVATLRDRAIIEVLFDSGAHRGQVAALTIDDVDIDEHVVLIRGAPTPGRGAALPVLLR